jgi:hypothetical protein
VRRVALFLSIRSDRGYLLREATNLDGEANELERKAVEAETARRKGPHTPN